MQYGYLTNKNTSFSDWLAALDSLSIERNGVSVLTGANCWVELYERGLTVEQALEND